MGTPLRILHVVVNMDRGGAETLIMNLYRNIDRTKVQFDFLTNKEGEFDPEILKLGGKIHRIPYITDVGHFNYIKELDYFFYQHPNYRIVHSHLDKMSGLVLRSAKKAGIPFRISHSHNTSSEGGLGARFYKWLVGQLIIKNATNFMACSHNAAKWLFKGNFNSTKILKNGIDTEKFTFNQLIRDLVRKELNLDKDEFIIGHVGRFNRQKNHSLLVDIFYRYNKLNKSSVLILVGEGPLQIDIQKKVRDLKISHRVRFLGLRSDIDRLLQAFDVIVFPSFHEGLPVSLIEAQGAGLPCLISDTISKEVDLGLQLVEFLPLSDINLWIQRLKRISYESLNHRQKFFSLANQGFEIRETAINLEKFYIKLPG
jgi:glycosyltransferase involved in cell wall biosynthesis